jgi:hypothetical protein
MSRHASRSAPPATSISPTFRGRLPRKGASCYQSILECFPEGEMAKLDIDSDYHVVKPVIDLLRHRIMDTSDDLIFHYCTADTLLLILKNKTLRFSDARCMNDGEELLWGERQLALAVARLRDRDDIPDSVPAVPKKFIDAFLAHWTETAKISKHFLSSFSLTGDSLSQWRAYADDAQGFAVGFCVNNIDVPANFFRVEYDSDKQQKEKMSEFDDQGSTDVWFSYIASCAYKNPAFVDEREVRGSHIVGQNPSEVGGQVLQYLGGISGNTEIKDAQIDYRVAKGRIVPYVDFSFQLERECAIKEIWMGPRCATPTEEFSVFLNTMGYGDVAIKTAGSRYR